jgi:hypothetical protein
VRELARFLIGGVDAIVLNAAATGGYAAATGWGAGTSGEPISSVLAANYLGHFLLVHLLVAGDALRPGARVVTVSALAAQTSRFAAPLARPLIAGGSYNDIWSQKKDLPHMPSIRSYLGTKYLAALFAQELAVRAPTLVVATAVPAVAARTALSSVAWDNAELKAELGWENGNGPVAEVSTAARFVAAGLFLPAKNRGIGIGGAGVGGEKSPTAFVSCKAAPQFAMQAVPAEACEIWEAAARMAGIPVGFVPALELPTGKTCRDLRL